MPRLSSTLLAIALVGCTYISDKEYNSRLDLDGDGVLVPQDCNDEDPDVSDLDQYYVDADGDGVGGAEVGELQCGPSPGMVVTGGDICDDNPALLLPKTWFQDQDGDGLGDESLTEDACAPPGPDWVEVGTDRCDNAPNLVLPQTWYEDKDGDGLGDPEASEEGCVPPAENWVSVGTDLCDTDPDLVLPTTWFQDVDGDGLGDESTAKEACSPTTDEWVTTGTDACDNDAALLNPKTWFEDNDGDGLGDAATAWAGCAPPGPNWVDVGTDQCDGDATLVIPKVWYEDGDGDGLGNELLSTVACAPPAENWVEVGTDRCDNDESLVLPAAWFEDADGDGLGDPEVSQDACEAPAPGWVDNDLDQCPQTLLTTPREYWADDDGDGIGVAVSPAFLDCSESPPSGYTFEGSEEDCDDTDPTVFPGAQELCDGTDHNCNGSTDDGVGLEAPEYFVDADLDGFPSETIVALCDQGLEHIPRSAYPTLADLLPVLDCDDTNDAVNPSAPEIYDGADDLVIDNDCDPSNDRDHDGDGDDADYYGGTDCDDTDPTRAGTLPEIYYDVDAVDNDCDAATDSFDRDGDGALDAMVDGSSHPDAGSGDARDCDDDDAQRSPFFAEQAGDAIDGNCDGQFVGVLCGLDLDGDGFGSNDPAEQVVWDGDDPTLCLGISETGFPVGPPGDCDDQQSNVNPDEPEVHEPGIVDNDCDPTNDRDIDGDGDEYVGYGGTDCDDLDAAIAGILPETYYDVAAVDNDCDLTTDSFDQDGDGALEAGVDASQHPAAGDGAERDCDDLDAARAPGLFEVADDGVDNNCDGTNTGILCGLDLDGDGQGSDNPDELVAFDGNTPSDCVGLSEVGLVVGPPGDCNDANPAIYTGAVEFCDDVDTNCDGDADELLIVVTDTSGVTTALPEGHHVYTSPVDIEFCSTGQDVAASFELTAGSTLTGKSGSVLAGSGAGDVITASGFGGHVQLTNVDLFNASVGVLGELSASGGAWEEVGIVVGPGAQAVVDGGTLYEASFDVQGELEVSKSQVENYVTPFIKASDAVIILRDLQLNVDGLPMVEADRSSVTTLNSYSYSNESGYLLTDSQLTIIGGVVFDQRGQWIDADRTNVYISGTDILDGTLSGNLISSDTGNLTLTNLEITGANTSSTSALIYTEDGDILLDGVVSNTATVPQDDALAFTYYGYLTVRDSTFTRTAEAQRTHLFNAGYGFATLEGSSFWSTDGTAPAVLRNYYNSYDGYIEIRDVEVGYLGSTSNPEPNPLPSIDIEVQGAEITDSNFSDNHCLYGDPSCSGHDIISAHNTNLGMGHCTFDTDWEPIRLSYSYLYTPGGPVDCASNSGVSFTSSYGVNFDANSTASVRACSSVGTYVGSSYVPAAATNQTWVQCTAGPSCTGTPL